MCIASVSECLSAPTQQKDTKLLHSSPQIEKITVKEIMVKGISSEMYIPFLITPDYTRNTLIWMDESILP